jgi:nucleoside-diphosphate-sugar epimerase
MIALVTGCAGFIGSHLTEQLLANGHEVVGIDALTDTYDRQRKLSNLEAARGFDSFQFVEEDLAEGDVRSAVDRCELIFHLAGEPGVRDSWGGRFDSYVHNNVVGTQRLLEAIAPHPDRRLVVASSSSVYGNAPGLPITEEVIPSPVSPYGVTKLAAENLCRAYAQTSGTQAVALRYFSVFGPRQRPDMAFSRFIAAALSGEAIEVYGTGTQMRDFTFVGDVVAATQASVEAADADCRAFNVGGGVATSVAAVLDLLQAITGRDLNICHAASARGDVVATHASVERSQAAFGYRPSVPLSEGLEAQVRWATSHHGVVGG